MRRSSRDRKPVERFQFNDPELSEREDSEDDEDRVVSKKRPKNKEFQDDQQELIKEKSRRLNKKMVSKQNHPTGAAYSEFTSKNDLFENVKACSGSKLNSTIDKWIVSYKTNKVGALCQIMNFVLLAAGAAREYIPEDTDLEALDREEIAVLLQDVVQTLARDDCSKSYPLSMSKQQGKAKSLINFRKKYLEFWEKLSDSLRSSVKEGVEDIKGIQCLQSVLEQVVALSRIPVVNVRDAVTEATFTICISLLKGRVDFVTQLERTERQLNAERKKAPGNSGMKGTPRLDAINQQHKRYTNMIAKLDEMIATVMTSVLAYRVKDVYQSIRATCLLRLGECMVVDPAHMVQDVYFTYLSTALYDQSELVRLECIHALFALADSMPAIDSKRNDESPVSWRVEQIETFCDFINRNATRLVDIASLDMDDAVEYEAFQLLRKLQQKGCLDNIDNEILDVADSTVFDHEASEQVRVAALEFMIEHIEGFEIDETEEARCGKAHKSKAHVSSPKGGGSDEERALLRQRRVAIQLETLIEFVEHHLSDIEEPDLRTQRIALFTHACLDSPMAHLLHEWEKMISLLLKEHNMLLSAPLKPAQISILLHICKDSACSLKESHRKTTTVKKRQFDYNFLNKSWGILNSKLQEDAAKLVNMFRSSSDDMSTVLELLVCYDPDALSSASSASLKSFKDLVKSVCEVMESTPHEDVVTKIAVLLKSWQSATSGNAATRSKLSAVINPSIQDLVERTWDKIKTSDIVIRAKSHLLVNASSGKSKKRRHEEDVLIDEVFSLAIGFGRLKALWSNMDCQNYTDIGLTLVEQCNFINESALELLRRADVTDPLSDAAESTLITAEINAIGTVGCILIWLTGRAFEISKKFKSNDNDNEESTVDDAKLVDEADSIVNSIQEIRTDLINTLYIWMDCDCELSGSALHRALQREAFKTIGNLRCLFSSKLSDHKGLSQLYYAPSAEVLNRIRLVFEVEGSRIKAQMHDYDSDESTREKAAQLLVDTLLNPLSVSFVYDIQNLNRRQASAVLCHITESHAVVHESVKIIMKMLKDSDPVKLLEVQMVALKSAFAEKVGSLIQARAIAASQDSVTTAEFDYEENEELIAAGARDIDNLAKKLSAAFGVGKIKDKALLESFHKFFELGIDQALTVSTQNIDDIDPYDAVLINIGFVSILEPYIRFLPSSSIKTLGQQLESSIHSSPILLELLQQGKKQISRRSQMLVHFTNFRAKLGVGESADDRNRARISTDTYDAQNLEDADDDSSDDITNRKSIQQGNRPSWGARGVNASLRLLKSTGYIQDSSSVQQMKARRPRRDDDSIAEGDESEAEDAENEQLKTQSRTSDISQSSFKAVMRSPVKKQSENYEEDRVVQSLSPITRGSHSLSPMRSYTKPGLDKTYGSIEAGSRQRSRLSSQSTQSQKLAMGLTLEETDEQDENENEAQNSKNKRSDSDATGTRKVAATTKRYSEEEDLDEIEKLPKRKYKY